MCGWENGKSGGQQCCRWIGSLPEQRRQWPHPVLLQRAQVRRAVSAMTDTERKLNAKLLREVEAAAAAGIPTVRSPTRSPGARA